MDNKDIMLVELKPVIAYTLGAAVLELIGERRPVTRRTIAEMVEKLSRDNPDITDELALDILKN